MGTKLGINLLQQACLFSRRPFAGQAGNNLLYRSWRPGSTTADYKRFLLGKALHEHRFSCRLLCYPSSHFSQAVGGPFEPLNDKPKQFDGAIPLDKIELKFVASSGPGGQHVNKTNTKAELRFHVASADWLPDEARAVFIDQQHHRMNKHGFYVITSEKTRSQLLNQADLLDRLREAIYAAYRKAYEPARSPEEVQAEEEAKRKRIKRAARYRLREKRIASADKQWRQSDRSVW